MVWFFIVWALVSVCYVVEMIFEYGPESLCDYDECSALLLVALMSPVIFVLKAFVEVHGALGKIKFYGKKTSQSVEVR